MKNKIIEIIENNPVIKQIYENNEGCFKNVIVSRIKESDDDKVLEDVMEMLALQCELYDTLLNNIAKFGSKELIKKCNEDINNIFASED